MGNKGAVKVLVVATGQAGGVVLVKTTGGSSKVNVALAEAALSESKVSLDLGLGIRELHVPLHVRQVPRLPPRVLAHLLVCVRVVRVP